MLSKVGAVKEKVGAVKERGWCCDVLRVFVCAGSAHLRCPAVVRQWLTRDSQIELVLHGWELVLYGWGGGGLVL